MVKNDSKMNNFDMENVRNIEEALYQEERGISNVLPIYTLVQHNSSCDVELTEASRKACIKSVMK